MFEGWCNKGLHNDNPSIPRPEIPQRQNINVDVHIKCTSATPKEIHDQIIEMIKNQNPKPSNIGFY